MIRSVKEIIEDRLKKRVAKNIAYEFQEFGVRLSEELNDHKHKTYYIKIAKEYPRSLIEQARDYALGYSKAKSKAKIFMWYLKENKKKIDINNSEK